MKVKAGAWVSIEVDIPDDELPEDFDPEDDYEMVELLKKNVDDTTITDKFYEVALLRCTEKPEPLEPSPLAEDIRQWNLMKNEEAAWMNRMMA